MSFVSNSHLDLAFEYVRNTAKNIFLTGKAGTGKTSFLHQIKGENRKRMGVTAPTGVAAINAGGMTLHSFFQLPLGLHLPGMSREVSNQRRFSRDKIQLLRTLDLLVIDEISMVRADLLDAVDDVLRGYRDDSRVFGGVQLLMIGDLHQLPPVVKPEDCELLRPHYETPYFFSSLALQKTDIVSIELKHIFRQSDRPFIDLLDRVRNNQIDAGVLETLNSRYIPGFQPDVDDAYITLTSHNASSYDLNAKDWNPSPNECGRSKLKSWATSLKRLIRRRKRWSSRRARRCCLSGMTSRRKNAISTAKSEKSSALPATKSSCAARMSGKTSPSRLSNGKTSSTRSMKKQKK